MKALVSAGYLLVLIATVQADYWFTADNSTLVQASLIETASDEESIANTTVNIFERVFFYLYTRANPTTYEQLYVDDHDTLQRSNWNSMKPTRFVTHGWMDSYSGECCTLVRDAILASGDYNVIVVDWSTISQRLYLYASQRVKVVGGWVAAMIDFLEKEGMDVSTIILAGHSLGAHVVGLSGLQASSTVGYVVGLDPALPLFESATSDSRIATVDAAYVQIIHTCGGTLAFKDPIGDVDFYPNGGSSQPGCILDIFGTCAHGRAYEYYAESLTSTIGFYGTYCSSYDLYIQSGCSGNDVALMGGSSPTTTGRGTYYLNTNSQSLYAMGA